MRFARTRLTLLTLAVAVPCGGCGSPGGDAGALPVAPCVTFESQPAGARFEFEDRTAPGYASLREAGLPLRIDLFEGSDGLSTWGALGRIEDGGVAGGSGKELKLEQASLVVDFRSARGLSLRFAEGPGNVNLRVNDDIRNVEDLVALDGQVVGGIPLEIDAGPDGRRGTLALAGPLEYFAIGGAQLWLDDICVAQPRLGPWHRP